jgi:Kef-type K+ transport systems, membrane components
MSAGSFFLFHLPYLVSVSLSLSVSIPSISITSVLLVKSGLIKIEDGSRLLGGVALSDVIGFIIFVSFHRPADLFLVDFLSLLTFIVVLYFLDMYLTSRSDKLVKWFGKMRSAKKEGVIFALVIVMGLAVSSMFEVIGITFVLGAFFSGLIIHKNTVGNYVSGVLSRTFQRINSSFFIPIYFSISGLSVSRIPFSLYPYAIFLIIISASVGGFAAYQFSKHHMDKISPSVTLGIFGGRGAVGIIIASLALSNGFINNTYYSIAIFATVVMAIAFTFVFERAMEKTGTKMENGNPSVE